MTVYTPSTIVNESYVINFMTLAVSKTIALGKIDVVAHIVGICPFDALERYPTGGSNGCLLIRLSFFLTHAVIPHMRAAGYSIRIGSKATSTVYPVSAGRTLRSLIIDPRRFVLAGIALRTAHSRICLFFPASGDGGWTLKHKIADWH